MRDALSSTILDILTKLHNHIPANSGKPKVPVKRWTVVSAMRTARRLLIPLLCAFALLVQFAPANGIPCTSQGSCSSVSSKVNLPSCCVHKLMKGCCAMRHGDKSQLCSAANGCQCQISQFPKCAVVPTAITATQSEQAVILPAIASTPTIIATSAAPDLIASDSSPPGRFPLAPDAGRAPPIRVKKLIS